ncbi:hypothetical protein I9018_23630 [Pseudomonas sp. MPFS]|uniref:hypothetical protein n=1 Tax=Pseudomonas sp. MPFS TaxID=2795724 RepID=UPI001F1439A9|nr:hypothetical protein [Pseudomonas sp. MPFS]UMZ10456.1 hypothetical protein I9018_23630 [Pseudomonas sp. MPFS]
MFNGLMRWLFGVLLVSLLGATAQASSSRQILVGTLGKMPIVMEISTSDPHKVTGRYFYQKYHHDLPLAGSLEEQSLQLSEGRESYAEDASPQAAFQLQRTAEGWQGQWQGANGKTLEVRLAPASAQEPKPGTLPYLVKLYREDLYEYLRLQGLTLKQGKQQDFMGYTLQWWSEPSSNLSMFKVIAGYPQDRQEQLNQLLMERLWREVGGYHECMLEAGKGGEFIQSVKPRFFSSAVLSVSIATSYTCGGAHPDFGDSPLNIDVNTGRDLSLTDVLWVGKGQPLKQSEHSALYEYNTQQLAPWLVEQFTALHPREMREPASEDEGCNYSDTGVWGDNSWYFTPRGLFISAHFPRVERDCDGPQWAVLPYSVVRKHPGAVAVELPKR